MGQPLERQKKKQRNIRQDDEIWDLIATQAKESGMTTRSAQIREEARLRDNRLIEAYYNFLDMTASGKVPIWLMLHSAEIGRIRESKGVDYTRAWNLLVDMGRTALKRKLKRMKVRFQAEEGPFQCPFCHAEPFDTKDKLEAHIRTKHPKAVEAAINFDKTLLSATLYFCPFCDNGPFGTKKALKTHVKSQHAEKYDALYRSGRKVAT